MTRFVEKNMNNRFSNSPICPSCGADVSNIAYLGVEDGDPGELVDPFECTCGCRWVRIYKYAETEIIEEGSKNVK